MEHTPEKDTMRSVIWQKMVAAVRDHKAIDLIKGAIYVSVVLIMCSAATDGGNFATRLMEWRNGAVPTITMILVSSFYAPRAFKSLVGIVQDAYESAQPEEEWGDEQTIEGMNTEQVIDHLITRSTFKREEVEARFGVPRYRYSALVKKLKEIGVLVTGENNMSVLNSEEWNRDSLRRLFAGKETAAELEREVRVVRSIPSPTPFERRPVTCAA